MLCLEDITLKTLTSLLLGIVLVAGVLTLTVATKQTVEQPSVVTPIPPTNVNIFVMTEVEPLQIENAYRLTVKASIPAGLHIYSIHQKGGPATILQLGPNFHISVLGEWSEVPAAQPVEYDWGVVNILTGEVEWSVDFKAFDARQIDFNNPPSLPVVTGRLIMYPCTGNMCLMPQTVEFTTGD
jgi:hypothetical protein